MDFLHTQKKIYIYIIIILLLIIGCLNSYIIYKIDKLKNNNQEIKVEEISPIIEEQPIENIINTEPKTFFVDIKGAINNPGVYLVEEGSIVNELINIAGGLKDDAFTKNINLSKSLSEEMVIIIYSNNEIDKINNDESICICNDLYITECIDNNASIISSNDVINDAHNNGKININRASLEEFMTLNGIGEAKAKAIIEYRNINGLFKSLEDIKNVSGISEKTYESIKDNIEL